MCFKNPQYSIYFMHAEEQAILQGHLVEITLFSEICDLQESVYEHVKDEGLFADIIQ